MTAMLLPGAVGSIVLAFRSEGMGAAVESWDVHRGEADGLIVVVDGVV